MLATLRTFFKLFHQIAFIVQAAGGVGENHIYIFCPCRLNCIKDNRGTIGAGMLGDHRDLIALTPDLKLFNRGGSKGITGRQHHGLALLLKLSRQLANGGGLADTIDTDD